MKSNDTLASVQTASVPSDDEAAEFESIDRRLLLSAAPSWLTSMFVHVVFLLLMALITVPAAKEMFLPEVTVGKALEEPKFETMPDDPPADRHELPPTEAPRQPLPEADSLDDIPAIDPVGALDPAAVAAPAIELWAAHAATLQNVSRIPGAPEGTGFDRRGPIGRRRELTGPSGSPDPSGNEKAVEKALRWLAAHQNPDGSWSFDHRRGTCQNRCPNAGTLPEARLAATGLALLPFLGRGETHVEGKHRQTVKNGLAYLLRNMKAQGNRGDLSEAGANQYGHGICSIALCEAYAMTNDRALMQPAQMALNQIAYNQDPVGGGWRYTPKQAGDTSVVGWQLMALKSGHMAYLDVQPQTIAGASKFLDSVQSESGARYGYTTPGTGDATTAVGLLSRMYLGWKRDHDGLQRGVAALDEKGPSPDNMYYNYYATQVMRHYGGEPWERWNKKMHDQIIQSQSQEGHTEGSWYVAGGDHGSNRGGRVYVTAMATMILEVYYRHSPLYKPQAVEEDFRL